MNQDFATIGKQVKAKSGAYADLPDEVVGQAYLKKTNPLQYEIYKSQVNNIGDIQKTQATSEIQAQKELQVNQAKNEQNYAFEQAHPKPLSPSEQTAMEDTKAKKEAAARLKNDSLSIVDDLLNRDTGAITGARNPLKFITGEAQYTQNLVKQLKAKLSLDARSILKGSGQISDKETQMLEDSIAALNTNMSNEDFKKELVRIKKGLGGQVQENPDISTSNTSGADQVLRMLAPNIAKTKDYISSIPQTFQKAAEEAKTKGLFGQSSPELVNMVRGQDQGMASNTGNGLVDSALSAGKMTTTSSKAGAEAGGYLTLVKGILNGIGSATSGGIKNPISAASERRIAAAAEGAPIKNESVLNSILDKVSRDKTLPGTTRQKIIEAATENFGKPGSITPTESLGEFTRADAYTQGGKILKGTMGKYNFYLRDALKEIWQKENPGILKETQNMAKIFKVGKTTKGVVNTVGMAAGGTAGALYLYNLLKGMGK